MKNVLRVKPGDFPGFYVSLRHLTILVSREKVENARHA